MQLQLKSSPGNNWDLTIVENFLFFSYEITARLQPIKISPIAAVSTGLPTVEQLDAKSKQKALLKLSIK